jgi:hypothetical protein
MLNLARFGQVPISARYNALPMMEIGLLSPLYNITKDLLRWALKTLEKEDPAKIIELRQKWKAEIQGHLRWIDDVVGHGEAIVRDVRRADLYPEADEKGKGISPWFRVGLLDLYHRGLQVGLRIKGLRYDGSAGSGRYADYVRGEEPHINAHLVGRIPFERIVSVDWDGDEYYGIPHIYCRFTSKRKEPYEEMIFCERRRLDHLVYYSEIARYDDVDSLSKRLKVGDYSPKMMQG